MKVTDHDCPVLYSTTMAPGGLGMFSVDGFSQCDSGGNRDRQGWGYDYGA